MDNTDQTVTVTIQVAGVSEGQTELNSFKGSVDSFGNDIQSGIGVRGIAIGTAIGQGITNAVGTAMDTVKDIISSGIQLISNSITSAADFQQVNLSFEALLGGADQAEQMLTKLSSFSLNEGVFNTDQLDQYAKSLLIAGQSQDQVMQSLEELGNMAVIVGSDRIPMIVQILKATEDQGFLSSQGLKQLENAGVDLQSELAREMGVSTETISAMAVKNLISYDSVNQALTTLYGTSGKYGQEISKQADTFQGLQTRLQNYGSILMNVLGGISANGQLIKGGLLDALQTQLDKFFGTIVNNDGTLTTFGTNLSKGFGDLINTYLPEIMNDLPNILTQIDKIGTSLPQRFSELKKTISDIKDDVTTAYAAIETMGGVIFRAIKASLLQMDSTIISVVQGMNIQIAEQQMGWDKLTNQTDDFNKEQKLIITDQQRITDAQNASLLATSQFMDKISGTNTATQQLNGSLDNTKNILNTIQNSLDHPNLYASPGQQFALSTLGRNFAEGGIIPRAENGIIAGNDTSGDHQFINANSGEMIINRNDQQALFTFLKQLPALIGNRQVINATFNNSQGSNYQTINNLTQLLGRL